MEKGLETHKVWHKFSKFITNNYGKDLYSEYHYINVGKKKLKYRNFNENELFRRLVGYEVITKIEKYVKKNCPEIRIVNCDDNVHSGSIILLIPHPKMGISVMFIPQCTNTQNVFFLYKNHYKNLMKNLTEMEDIYGNDEEEL